MTALAVFAAVVLAYGLASKRLELSAISVAAIPLLDAADLGIVVYALLSLTLVRMLPVAVAVAGMGFDRATVAFMGWFGPRGLASVILAFVVAEEEPELPGLGVILAAMTVTVLASVLLHGLSAVPLSRAYGRGRASG